MLMQGRQPIAYFSEVLSARAQGKSIYERELVAIVLSVQKWRLSIGKEIHCDF